MIVHNTKDIQTAFSRFKPEVKQVVKPAVTAASVPKPVTSRLNYDVVGVCPYCKKPMGYTEACGQRVYLCSDDRFVSPLPNKDLEDQE